jgi:lysophospholipase L1-like esterase
VSGVPEASKTPPLSRRKAAAFRAILLAGTVAIVTGMIVSAEFVLRYRERHRTAPPDYFPSIYYPHRRVQYGLVPGLDYFGWFTINSLGFRGPETSRDKPDGALRIVCIGGSTTFDTSVTGPNPPWVQVLENALMDRFPGARIEVLNLGIPGAAVLDSLIDLQTRGLQLEPDIVVVYQGHNDFRYSTRPPDDGGLFPGEQPTRTRMSRWLQLNSLLYSKAYAPLASIFTRAAIGAGLAADPAEGFSEQAQQAAIDSSLIAFRTHLRTIGALTAANGLHLVLPELAYPGSDRSGTLAGASAGVCEHCEELPTSFAGLSYARVAAGYEAYNSAIREAAEAFSATFVETSAWIPSATEYYSDTVHFTPAGSRIFGTRLGEALAPIVEPLLTSSN